MSIVLTSIDSLTAESVQERQKLLTQVLREAYPELDFSSGALHDIVLYLHAILDAKTSTELDRYKSAQSLLAITRDPTLADDETADHIFSNYNVTRNAAAFAAGSVKLHFQRDLPVLIPSDTEFTFGSDIYRVTEGIVAGSTTSSVYDQLTAAPDGTYTFTVHVIAVEAGTRAPVLAGDPLETTLGGVIRAYAERDFDPGKDAESNARVLTRLADGMATPCWGNRFQIAALIRNNVEDVTDISVIGFGDAEMTRDQLTVFPISVGGKADIYVKTALEYKTVTTTARYLGIEKGKERWSTIIPKETFPGFYRVTTVTKDNYAFPVTNETIINGMQYTAGQQVYLEFETDDLMLTRAVGEEETFDLTLTGQRNIQDIHDIFENRELMPLTEDALVRSAYPAWVTITLRLSTPQNNETAIQKAIASYIDSLGFTDQLLSSELTQVILPELLPTQRLLSLHMEAEVWGPEDKVYRSTAAQQLLLPEDFTTGVTARTTVFYTDRVIIQYA